MSDLTKSDTPRTDEFWNQRNKLGLIWSQACTEITDHARQLERELGETKEKLKYEQALNWTPSLCYRINELVREHLQAGTECKDGESASRQIQVIHGYCGNLQSQLSQREVQLKTTLDELAQYKLWANHEIELLKTNNKEAIREHERMADTLAELERDKARLDWLDTQREDLMMYDLVSVRVEKYSKLRTAIDSAMSANPPKGQP